MVLRELGAVTRSLEEAFFELTEDEAMTALLRAELLKLRTTRTFVALTAAAVGTSLLITVLVGLLTEPTQDEVLSDVFTSDTSSLFILDPRGVGITGEWRHRTITSSLLAAPDRLRFLAAKTVAFAAAGARALAADLDRDSDRRAHHPDRARPPDAGVRAS